MSITAGEIILVTSKDTGSEAWWEGVGKSGKGQFPASYVEEASNENVNSTPIKGFLVSQIS